jgi:hypothetical protein
MRAILITASGEPAGVAGRTLPNLEETSGPPSAATRSLHLRFRERKMSDATAEICPKSAFDLMKLESQIFLVDTISGGD